MRRLVIAGECEWIRGGIMCLVFHVGGLVLGLTFLLLSLLRCANEEGLVHAWWFWMKWMVTQRGGDPDSDPDSAITNLRTCSYPYTIKPSVFPLSPLLTTSPFSWHPIFHYTINRNLMNLAQSDQLTDWRWRGTSKRLKVQWFLPPDLSRSLIICISLCR